MKKFLITILSIICCFGIFIFAGCKESGEVYGADDEKVLETLCIHNINVGAPHNQYFFRDLTTNNIYFYSVGGNIVPYYNENGEIMKYKEFEKVHINKLHK